MASSVYPAIPGTWPPDIPIMMHKGDLTYCIYFAATPDGCAPLSMVKHVSTTYTSTNTEYTCEPGEPCVASTFIDGTVDSTVDIGVW